MLLYAWDLVEFGGRFDGVVEDAPDLRALLTSVLVLLMRHQVRRGLRGDYVERREELMGVRGRIDFGETLRGMSLHRGRLRCEFEEFTLNVPRNQIVRSTLNDSLNRGFTEVEEGVGKFGGLVSDVESLLRMLYEIDRVRVTRRLIASELRLLGRNEREYKLMLKICEMLQDPSMPLEDGDSGEEQVGYELLRPEYEVFERFVANFYRLKLRGKGWEVSAQRQQRWNETVEGRVGNIRLPVMKPDVYLRHESGRIVVVDTKWYGSPVAGGVGDDAVISSHMFQMYGYLASQDHLGDAERGSTGVLLYGQTGIGARRLRTEVDGHPFWVETLDLTQDWKGVERDLEGLVLS